MAIRAKVLAPLINVNEPSAQVVEVPVREGQRVDAGAVVCVLETTKASADVTTPEAGYVRGLTVATGQALAPDALICVITDTADEPVAPEPAAAGAGRAPGSGAEGDAVPDGVRITKPALALAGQLGVELATLPKGIVTEETVRRLAASRGASGAEASAKGDAAASAGAGAGGTAPAAAAPAGPAAARVRVAPPFDNRIIIFGGGGHARAILDLLAQLQTFRVVGVIDDSLKAGEAVLGARVIGTRDALPHLAGDGIRLAANAVGGIRNIADRVQAFRTLADAGFAFPTLRHPRAVVEPSAVVEDGAQLFALAYVGSAVTVRRGAIVNTGALLSHDCDIGEFAHVAPGAVLAGAVRVGARTLVGMGVTVSLGLTIGSDARIGNGANVLQDVPDGTTVPAGSVWPPRRG